MKTQLAVKDRVRVLGPELEVALPHEAMQLMTLEQDPFWKPVYMGQAPIPQQPVRIGDWLVSRSIHDTSPLPLPVQRHVEGIYAAGIRPKDWLIAHEIVQQLKSPEPVPQPQLPDFSGQWRTAVAGARKVADKAAPVAWEVTKAAAKVTAGLIAASAVCMVTVAGIALMSLATVDPLLIAVMDADGDSNGDHWILVDAWDLPA